MLLFIRQDNPMLNTWQMVVLSMRRRQVKPSSAPSARCHCAIASPSFPGLTITPAEVMRVGN
jgi:hypothetical protein